MWGVAAGNWVHIDGAAAARGLRSPLSLRADRFFNLVLHWALQNVAADERESWTVMLEAPLPLPKDPDALAKRIAAPTAADRESEMADFSAFYSQVKAGG